MAEQVPLGQVDEAASNAAHEAHMEVDQIGTNIAAAFKDVVGGALASIVGNKLDTKIEETSAPQAAKEVPKEPELQAEPNVQKPGSVLKKIEEIGQNKSNSEGEGDSLANKIEQARQQIEELKA